MYSTQLPNAKIAISGASVDTAAIQPSTYTLAGPRGCRGRGGREGKGSWRRRGRQILGPPRAADRHATPLRITISDDKEQRSVLTDDNRDVKISPAHQLD